MTRSIVRFLEAYLEALWRLPPMRCLVEKSQRLDPRLERIVSKIDRSRHAPVIVLALSILLSTGVQQTLWFSLAAAGTPVVLAYFINWAGTYFEYPFHIGGNRYSYRYLTMPEQRAVTEVSALACVLALSAVMGEDVRPQYWFCVLVCAAFVAVRLYTTSAILLCGAGAVTLGMALALGWGQGAVSLLHLTGWEAAMLLLAALIVIPAWYLHQEIKLPERVRGSKAATILAALSLAVTFTAIEYGPLTWATHSAATRLDVPVVYGAMMPGIAVSTLLFMLLFQRGRFGWRDIFSLPVVWGAVILVLR